MGVTVALVPVRFSVVCAPVALLLFTVSVAVSFAPGACVGVNCRTMAQLRPDAMNSSFAHVPLPVLEKSAAFGPEIV